MVDSLVYLVKVLHIVLPKEILQSDSVHLAGGHSFPCLDVKKHRKVRMRNKLNKTYGSIRGKH